MPTKSTKALECHVSRHLPAPPEEAYDAWLDPRHPGSPWHEYEKLILNPSVDGFFYWLVHGITHYGRFTAARRPGRIQHTWVSPNTLGKESMVTVTFKENGKETLMALVHSDLPNARAAKAHEEAWIGILDSFANELAMSARKPIAGRDARHLTRGRQGGALDGERS